MKRLLVIATLVSATSAFAKTELDARMDHSQTNTTSPTTSSANGTFTPTRARVNFEGKVSDNMTASAQVDLVKLSGTAFSADGTAVNYFMLAHKLNDNGTLTMGKLTGCGLSGIEDTYGASTTDSYFSGAIQKNATYRPYGFMYTHMINDNHNIKAVVTNNDNGTGLTGSATGNTNGVGYGLSYDGKFGSAIRVIASYTAAPDESAAGKFVNDNYTSAGVNYEADAWSAGLTYNMSTNAGAGTGDIDLTANDIVLNFKYDMGKWRFPIKAESATGSLGAGTGSGTTSALGGAPTSAYSKNANDTLTQYSIAAEYRPDAGNKDIRYHIAYLMKSQKMDTSASASAGTADTNTVFIGMRFKGDIGK